MSYHPSVGQVAGIAPVVTPVVRRENCERTNPASARIDPSHGGDIDLPLSPRNPHALGMDV
jgi:hypothetical protein